MLINLYYFKNKKIWGFIIINFFIGLYISTIRLKHPESLYFDDLYFYAREGLILDFGADGFDVQTFMSIISTVISIPIVCSQFSKNYTTKRCYIATKYKKHSYYFINEIINIAILCFLLSFFYSVGICAFCATISNMMLHNLNFFLTYLISIFNSTLLLLAFSLLAIPFCIPNDKAAILSDIILFMMCTVTSYYLPIKYKYYDIVMIYFVNTMFQNNKLISHNSIVCYVLTFLIIALAAFAGNMCLKSKDVI